MWLVAVREQGGWDDLMFGVRLRGCGREMRARPVLTHTVAVGLVGFSIGETGGLGLLMAFYTDRVRKQKNGG